MQNVKKRKFDSSATMYPGTPIRTYFPNRSSMLGKLAPSQLAQVRRLIKNEKEVKHCLGFFTGSPSYAGTMNQILIPAQGVSSQQRIGDEIENCSLTLRGTVQGVNMHQFRIIAFQYLSDNATAPLISDVLVPGLVGSFYITSSPYNPDSNSKIKILADKSFCLDGYNQIKQFKMTAKCRNIEYETGSATQAKNALYLLTIQDGTVSLNTIYITTEFKFTDA